LNLQSWKFNEEGSLRVGNIQLFRDLTAISFPFAAPQYDTRARRNGTRRCRCGLSPFSNELPIEPLWTTP
jgi:hypothetical protein